MRADCGEIHDDDAVDPREYFSTKQSQRSDNKKARQLCRQVAETLDQVLASQFEDDALQRLRVSSVFCA